MLEARYENCRLCPRECGIDRTATTGYCGETAAMRIARAALHFWEEPCLCGGEGRSLGSGAVFFSGCPLGCVYCQNREISCGEVGREISVERLVEIFFELEEKGACNINLVTPDCFFPDIAKAVATAKQKGMAMPFIFNVSGYEKRDTLRELAGLCDIWLIDHRYAEGRIAEKYSNAPDYPDIAREAIAEAVRQQPELVFGGNGELLRGVIVRQLLLPGHLRNSRFAVKYLHDTYGDAVMISIMSQYTPNGHSGMPELERSVTESEYEALVRYCREQGIERAYIQDGSSAAESFIPDFNFEGV